MSTTEPVQDEERVRLRWGWIIICTALGLVLLAVAGYGNGKQWPEVITGTLVNVGSALLFSFILFFFENRFTRRVTRTVQKVTADAEERITAQAAEFTTRLADLESRLQEQMNADQSDAEATVNGLTDDLTAATVRTALERATEDGRIAAGAVTVPGYEDARNLRVKFTIATQELHSTSGVQIITGLRVIVDVEKKVGAIGTPVVEMPWEDEDVADVARTLTQMLHRADRHEEARTVNWTYVFTQLQRALELANTVTTQSPAFDGSLNELVTADWVVTSNGVERLSDHAAAPFAEMFPSDADSLRPRPFMDEVVPAAPEGVDDELWVDLRGRARTYRGRSWF